MKLLLVSAVIFLASISARAHAKSVKCAADHHVLAHYENGSGQAIERETRSFELDYEAGKMNINEISLGHREISAITGSIFDSRDEFGGGKPIEGVHVEILDFATGYKQAANVPLEGRRNHLSVSLLSQPGILPNEIKRDIFWSVTCRWAIDN